VDDPFSAATPADERVHAPGPEPFWNESWYFDFVDPDGTLGGYVRIGLYPNLGVCWYWACVVGEGRKLVTVVDHTVPLPRAGGSLELRHDGLWADHNCEAPLDHWSLGLEAFGVMLDDPADTYSGMLGERMPLGFELDWETDGAVFRWPSPLDRYEVPCRVHGQILVGDESISFEGWGQRDHSWGVRDWWSNGWCWSAFRLDDAAGTRVHAVTLIPSIGMAFGYVQGEAGNEVVSTFAVDDVMDLRTERFLDAYRVETPAGGVQLSVEPVAWSPVLLVDPDGRESRFPRAMCRVDDGTSSGVGWIEFNRPPGWAPQSGS
jgi:hypothetical protein